MTEERKHAILFAATILAAPKLNESGIKPWAVHVTITDAIDKVGLILETIDERWPAESGNSHSLKEMREAANYSTEALFGFADRLPIHARNRGQG